MNQRVVFVLVIVGSLSVARAQSTLNVPMQFSTIQSAIQAASTDDLILVAPGTYNETIDFLGKKITVRSSSGSGVTTIDAQQSGVTVCFLNGELRDSVLDGFTITGGLGETPSVLPSVAGPGGILCEGTSPTIQRCIIEGNVGGAGLSIASGFAGEGGAGGFESRDGGSPLVDRCNFRNNIGGVGGSSTLPMGVTVGGRGGPGAALWQGAAPVFALTVFELNTGGDGGNSSGGTFEVAGHGGAGAMRHRGAGVGVGNGNIAIFSCIVRQNTGGAPGMSVGAGPGEGGDGALIAEGAAIGSITNTMFVDNCSGGIGGSPDSSGALRYVSVVLFSQPYIELFNCTIVNNMGSPGTSTSAASGRFRFFNSIVRNNVPGAQIGPFNVAVGFFSNISGPAAGANNINAPALFVDSAGGDYHLTAASPCIDAGDASILMNLNTDFESDPRVVNAAVDIGADEACLPGSGEDLTLSSVVNSSGDPDACEKFVSPGDLVTIEPLSPQGGYTGLTVSLLGYVHFGSVPLGAPAGFPEVHVDPVGAFIATTWPMLPASGAAMTFPITAGPSGLRVRLQLVGLNNGAANGIFATSRAHDIVLQ